MRWTRTEIKCLIAAKKAGFPDREILRNGILPPGNARSEASVKSILYRIQRRKKLAHRIFFKELQKIGIGDRTAKKMFDYLLYLMEKNSDSEIFKSIISNFWVKKQAPLEELIPRIRKLLTYNGSLIVY